MLDACVDLEARPEAVGDVRRFVRETLARWELNELVDDAVLVTSELVTNAVLHARTEVRVRLSCETAPSLRIDVQDGNDRGPVHADGLQWATSGRGLMVVAALCSEWGTAQADDGKIVWGQLGPRKAPGVVDADCLDLDKAHGVAEALANESRILDDA